MRENKVARQWALSWRHRFGLGWLLLLLLGSYACTTTVPASKTPTVLSSPSPGERPMPVASGPVVKPFSLLSPLGDRVEYVPGKEQVVCLIAFWSPTWDKDHAYQEKVLRELMSRYDDHHFRAVVIAYDEKPSFIRAYLKKRPVPFEVAMGETKVYDDYALKAVPTYILVAPDGRRIALWVGHQTVETLEQKIQPFISYLKGT